MPKEDADLLRFLWWPGGDFSQSMQEYRMGVHLFGATSSPSCANYALRKCAEDNKAYFSQQVIDTILYSFYVDDCLASIGSEDEAINLYSDLRDICACHTPPHGIDGSSGAVCMDKMWRRELRLPPLNLVFWTDSTTVLKSINNETSRFCVFVENQVSEILKASSASQWRNVNTTPCRLCLQRYEGKGKPFYVTLNGYLVLHFFHSQRTIGL